MDDRTLLELAAKAAGIKTHGWRAHEFQPGYYVLPETETGAYCVWNPLTDDGDSLRLAVRLRIVWGWYSDNAMWARCEFDDRVFRESHERAGTQDEMAATRRAIVRAAAEIGRNHG
jgi:hypothetical protein